MKKVLTVLVVFGLGVALGRLFDDASRSAEAGGGNALPPGQDTNGDGARNLSDLPATGQTTCYDVAGANIPCDGATCPGQDGRYQTGCPSKGRFEDNKDGTVTDSCTGLIWQQNTADVNGDRQVDFMVDTLAWCEAVAYCENLTFAGHDDWRLPNVRELQSIVDYGRFKPSIDPVFGASSSLYWSSTSVSRHPNDAWLIHFGDGWVGFYNGKHVGSKDVSYNVRAVRSGP